MEQKPVILCRDCSNAMELYGVGFCSVMELRCADRGCMRVEPNDGCTLGIEGKHGCMIADCDVLIDGYAAVNGWNDEQ